MAMTTFSELRTRVTDISTCPICLELFRNPTSLPCLHTYCFDCLDGHFKDQLPGQKVLCPVCRQELEIPSNGVSGFPRNFFIQSLVDARQLMIEATDEVPCEVCFADDAEDANIIPPATMLCVDCDQKLCGQCSRPHTKMKGGPHKVIALNKVAEVEIVKLRGSYCEKHDDEQVKLYCFDCQTNICLICSAVEHDQHRRQEIAKVAEEFIRQIDADLEPISSRIGDIKECLEQLDKKDRQYLSEMQDTERAIRIKGDEVKTSVDEQEIEMIEKLQSFKCANGKEIQIQKERLEMALLALESFQIYCTELKVRGKSSDIARFGNDLHTRANELLRTCMKSDDFHPVSVTVTLWTGHVMKIRDFLGRVQRADNDDLQNNFITTQSVYVGTVEENFEELVAKMEQGQKLASKQLEDSNQVVDELREQLRQKSATEKDLQTQLSESSSEMSQVTKAGRENETKWKTELQQMNDKVQRMQDLLNEAAAKEKTSERQLETMRQNERKLSENVKRQTEVEKALTKQLDTMKKNVQKLNNDLSSTEGRERALKAQVMEIRRSENLANERAKLAEKRENEQKAELDKTNEMVIGLREHLKEAQDKEQIMLPKIEELERKEPKNSGANEAESSADAPKQQTDFVLLKEHFMSTPRVIKTLPEGESIWGLTAIDDKLYVLRDRSKDQLDIHNMSDYSLERQMTVQGLANPTDMTSCKHHRCLYIADRFNNCIHKVLLSGKVSKWPIKDRPTNISVTRNFNVLVTFKHCRKIKEFTSSGEKLREINLQSDVDCPWHAAELSSGHLVVCHSNNNPTSETGLLHRVFTVGVDGRVIQCYGDGRGSQAGQVNLPCHIAVDKDNFVFVADNFNQRVLLLSPSLQHVRYVVTRTCLKWKPLRLHLDADSRRLYVAENEWVNGKWSNGRVVVLDLSDPSLTYS